MKQTSSDLRRLFRKMTGLELMALGDDDVAEWNRDLLAKLKALQPAWRESNRQNVFQDFQVQEVSLVDRAIYPHRTLHVARRNDPGT